MLLKHNKTSQITVFTPKIIDLYQARHFRSVKMTAKMYFLYKIVCFLQFITLILQPD